MSSRFDRNFRGNMLGMLIELDGYYDVSSGTFRGLVGLSLSVSALVGGENVQH